MIGIWGSPMGYGFLAWSSLAVWAAWRRPLWLVWMTITELVIGGKGYLFFLQNGNIKISHEGFRTQAFQSNKNLLLSPTAQVHTLPKLEISTDDVKCSHGASVASLDPAQLFYLESRGIRQDQAEKMLIEAYTYPVISKIPDEELRKKYIVSEEDLV
jgi:Fe-S cluster assembly scaffold protein SufB